MATTKTDYNKYEAVIVEEDDFSEAVNDYIGFCPDCSAFTREMTEPDAEHYHCDECGNDNVLGAEQAFIIGLIIFET